ADLGGAVLAVGGRTAHELKVVDDDEPELAALARLPSGPRTQLRRGEAGRLVDVQAHVAQPLHGLGESPPFVVAQAARAQVLLIDATERTHHTQGELR